VTGAGSEGKQCGAGLGGLRGGVGRVRSLQVRGGSGKDFSNSCGCGAG